jgi:hypothetical protein
MAMAHATRHDGRPLFDRWFDIEGVTDLTEEYLEARSLAQTGNKDAKLAVSEIEAETGGPIGHNADAYGRRTVVEHAADIAASGIRGVMMVHAADDGLVGTDQTQEMAAGLTQVGVPADVYAVGTTGPKSEPGTTLDSYLPVAHPEPFAGHGYEGSSTQIVIQTGLQHLDAILQGRAPRPGGFHEHVVDGTVGQVV